MSKPKDQTSVTRRAAIATLGTGAVVGLGGVYALSRSGTARVEGKTITNVEDGSVVLGPDGAVEDVTLNGSVEISYESPDIPIREVAGGMTLIYLGRSDDGPDPANDRIEGGLDRSHRTKTENNHEDSYTFPFSVSLIDGWDFEPSDFDPEPGETASYRFQVVARSALYENVGDSREEAVELFGDEHYGNVIVEREAASGGGDAQEPLLKIHSADFGFSIQTV